MEDTEAKKFIYIWYPMLYKMTWKDVKKEFTKEFTTPYCTIEDDSNVSEQIDKYKNVISNTHTLFISYFNGGTAK